MSDPADQQPIGLDWRGKRHVLAVLTHHEESLLVSEHLAFAEGLIEGSRGLVRDEQSYQRHLNAHRHMAAAGAFAYGDVLSMQWLWTAEGRAALLDLLMGKGTTQKGAPPPERHVLVKAFRDKDAALIRAFEQVLERDFFVWWSAVKKAARIADTDAGTSEASADTATTPSTPTAS